MARAFVTVDVFTDRAFGGNPLAVVLDAVGLSTEQMQQIAREFGYSETTFVLPPEDPANDARVRIFTPMFEMPFAGHPNVGTAYVLARAGTVNGKPVGEVLRFEEIAGLVPVEVERDEAGTATGAMLTAPQLLSVDAVLDPAAIAACVSLKPGDMIGTPTVASVGAPFILAQVRDRAALARSLPDLTQFQAHLDDSSPEGRRATGVHLYARVEETGLDLRTRMFAPLKGVAEDPATGSANCALAAFLARHAQEPQSFRIAQGVEMGRPSLLRALAGPGITRIGGDCVPMMEGTLLA
jgi:trans-2,3-dihydro-3-hydroxyanthranilate isomerase